MIVRAIRTLGARMVSRVAWAALVMVILVSLLGAARANSAVYWAINVVPPVSPPGEAGPAGVGRANLNGTAVSSGAFPYGSACGVAVDASHVYWGGANGIARASLDGVDVEPGFIPGVNAHCALAVDDAHIYWLSGADAINASGIGRANLDGTGVQLDWITGLNTPRGMTVGGGHVYWVSADGSVGRANIDGTQANPSFILGPGGAGSAGVAVDDAHVYWSNTWTGTIGRANLNGSEVDHSFIVDPSPQVPGITFLGLAVDATHLYWDEYPGRIGRALLDGSGVELDLVPKAGGITRGVAVDARTAVDQSLASSPASSPYGQPLTLTATLKTTDPLAPSPAIPTGTVTFLIDGVEAGPPVTVNGVGTASLSPPYPLDVGTVVTARYSGNSAYLPVADEFSPDIHSAATSTHLTTSANPATEGGEVEVVATVRNTETDIVPFGSVTFYIDGIQALDPLPLDEDGQAGVIASDLPPGDFTVEARYQDDTADIADFLQSSDSYVQHVVAHATASPTPSATPPPTPTVTPTPVPDVTAPALRISVKTRARLARTLKRGLRVAVKCSEPCQPRVSATVDRRTAKRLRLGKGTVPVVIGQSVRSTQPAVQQSLRVKFGRRAKRALTAVSKVGVTLRVRATDAAGNVSVATHNIRLAK